VAPELKVCGLTRPKDVEAACAAGAAYVGVIFAGGPRHLTAETAAHILANAPAHVLRVGVFAEQGVDEIARIARVAGLSLVQLHADPGPEIVGRVRDALGIPVWATVRVSGTELPASLGVMLASADGVVLDARVPGRLGGTGTALPWEALAGRLRSARAAGGRLILAGGLTPSNVKQAITLLAPDVVDVSSGVEEEPGLKNHALIRDFAAAAFSDASMTSP